jgi:hypothetical protein
MLAIYGILVQTFIGASCTASIPLNLSQLYGQLLQIIQTIQIIAVLEGFVIALWFRSRK